LAAGMVGTVGWIWPQIWRGLFLTLVSPFLLLGLIGRAYRRLFPAFIFRFDSTPNAYPMRAILSGGVTIGQILTAVLAAVNFVKLLS